MGSGASVEGAHTQPTRGQNRYFCHICRLAFNTSEVSWPHRVIISIAVIPNRYSVIVQTSASVPCPRCGDTFVESVEEVSYSGGGRTAFRVFHGGGRSDLEQMELSEEQRRRLFNAAALLQLLEAHLREELMALERAVRESESNKTPHELTSLEKHTYLRSATIDKEAMCAQPSCPICGEDFFVGETALQIQCSHLFHEKCVVPWLELKHNCPICRLDVSEKLPQPAELEELTVAEIKQRIQWHGGQPESTEDKYSMLMILTYCLVMSLIVSYVGAGSPMICTSFCYTTANPTRIGKNLQMRETTIKPLKEANSRHAQATLIRSRHAA